jgi:agmatinase
MIGLPTDSNSSHLRGPAKAPAAIRARLASGSSNLTSENGWDLEDATVFHDADDLPLAENRDDLRRITDGVAAAFRDGPCLFLGGDHFVTWPVLLGLREAGLAPPHLIQVDAHPDLYPDFDGNPHSHASPMARIMEQGLVASLTQIGVRTVNSVQRDQIERFGVTVVPARKFNEAFDALPDGPSYLSIDLDGLDPAFAPGVSHHEPGGLTVREVLDLIDRIPGPVIGADIVELNPDRDINGMTGAVAAKLVKQLVGRMAQDRGRTSTWPNRFAPGPGT